MQRIANWRHAASKIFAGLEPEPAFRRYYLRFRTLIKSV